MRVGNEEVWAWREDVRLDVSLPWMPEAGNLTWSIRTGFLCHTSSSECPVQMPSLLLDEIGSREESYVLGQEENISEEKCVCWIQIFSSSFFFLTLFLFYSLVWSSVEHEHEHEHDSRENLS